MESIASVDQANVVTSIHIRHGQQVVTTGGIETNGTSVLVVKWRYPLDEDSGSYQCIIYGTDENSLPFEESSRVYIPKVVASSQDFIDRIIELDSQLQNCTLHEPHGQSFVCSGAPNITELAEFYSPLLFGNHRYYYSKRRTVNDVTSSRSCAILGGYLAEIESKEELDAVIAVQRQYRLHDVLIAGTDVDVKGTWIFQRTGRKLEYLVWGAGEPNNLTGNEYCLYLETYTEKMNDMTCNPITDQPYLCEVPGCLE